MYEDCREKWVADLGNGNYKNPILFSDYSDPDVIRVGDDFFMVSSSFTYFPSIPVLHSKDLVNWKIVSYAVEKLPFEYYDVPQHGKGTWAPSIRYHEGKFYVCFATPDEGIFMAITDNPFGRWNDVVQMVSSCGWIDPCPFWDEDGEAYLIRGVAKSRCGLKSMLFLHKMSADGTKLLDEGVRVFDGRINHPTIEGPKLYKRNGYYYIFSPAGGVRTGWQMVARSKYIYGPYEHRVVMEQGDTPINGPHQGGYVELESGESWFIHFQDLETYGRVVHLQPMVWVEDWPIIGEVKDNPKCGYPVLEHKKPNVGASSGIIMPLETDNFDGDSLGLQWQWQARAREEFYALTKHNLRLFAKPFESRAKLICDAPNMLSQLIHTPNFEVVAKVDLNLEDGDGCGLIITGGNYYGLKMEKEVDKLYLKQVSYEYDKSVENGEIVNACMEIRLRDLKCIYLKIVMEYPGRMYFLYSYNGEEYAKLGYPANYTVSRKSWVGARVGIFCANFKDTNSKGYADFKYIRFS